MKHYVSVSVGAKMLEIGSRQFRRMCENKVFESAHKPGMGKGANWKVLRTEVLARKYNSHIPQL